MTFSETIPVSLFLNFHKKFPQRKICKHVNYSEIFNKIWNDACKKAGISIRLYNATRHSLGTQASRAGIPDSEIADVLNHCDDRMVKKHYVNKDDLERQRVVFERINNFVSINKVMTVNKPSTEDSE